MRITRRISGPSAQFDLFGKAPSAANTKQIKEAIEKADCKVLYLPPYSLDLNPIENTFSKLKAMLRACVEKTVTGLWNTVGKIVDCFSKRVRSNYFKAVGYGFS